MIKPVIIFMQDMLAVFPAWLGIMWLISFLFIPVVWWMQGKASDEKEGS